MKPTQPHTSVWTNLKLNNIVSQLFKKKTTYNVYITHKLHTEAMTPTSKHTQSSGVFQPQDHPNEGAIKEETLCDDNARIAEVTVSKSYVPPASCPFKSSSSSRDPETPKELEKMLHNN